MRFENDDLNDPRIADSSFERYYPADVGEAPDQEGVYVLMDKTSEVFYIGHSSGNGLKNELASKRNTAADRESKRCRWGCTKNTDDAKSLASDWISKYSPKNNASDK